MTQKDSQPVQTLTVIAGQMCMFLSRCNSTCYQNVKTTSGINLYLYGALMWFSQCRTNESDSTSSSNTDLVGKLHSSCTIIIVPTSISSLVNGCHSWSYCDFVWEHECLLIKHIIN